MESLERHAGDSARVDFESRDRIRPTRAIPARDKVVGGNCAAHHRCSLGLWSDGWSGQPPASWIRPPCFAAAHRIRH